MGQVQGRARAHADWATPNLALYPPRSPLTARVGCGVVGEIMGGFFIRKDFTSAPSLFISRGNMGSSPISPAAIPISKSSAAPPFFTTFPAFGAMAEVVGEIGGVGDAGGNGGRSAALSLGFKKKGERRGFVKME